MKRDRDNPWTQVARYSSLAFLLPAATVAGYLVGYLLDKLFQTNFMYLVLLLLGFAGGTIELIRELQKVSRDGSG